MIAVHPSKVGGIPEPKGWNLSSQHIIFNQITEAMEAVETDINPVISDETKKKLAAQIYEEGQVTVHCTISSVSEESCVRIWRTTYLIDKQSDHRSKLLHIEGVSQYPVWTIVPPTRTLHFTLIFSALPGSCKVFDFLEQIPEPGGFVYPGIRRNSTDIYRVDFS